MRRCLVLGPGGAEMGTFRNHCMYTQGRYRTVALGSCVRNDAYLFLIDLHSQPRSPSVPVDDRPGASTPQQDHLPSSCSTYTRPHWIPPVSILVATHHAINVETSNLIVPSNPVKNGVSEEVRRPCFQIHWLGMIVANLWLTWYRRRHGMVEECVPM